MGPPAARLLRPQGRLASGVPSREFRTLSTNDAQVARFGVVLRVRVLDVDVTASRRRHGDVGAGFG